VPTRKAEKPAAPVRPQAISLAPLSTEEEALRGLLQTPSAAVRGPVAGASSKRKSNTNAGT